MERLTTVGQGCCIACFECKDDDDDCGCMEIDKCLHRLRDYENTGLTPEEIMNLKEKNMVQKMYHPNPNMYYCRACGEKIAPIWDYCLWCGQHITDEN